MATEECWVLTEGHAGMQNQCIGLAEALGFRPVIKRVVPKAPWRWLPPNWWPQPLGLGAPETPLSPPWPRLVISCGRRAVASAMAIRRAGAGRTVAVHIQVPHVPADRFDAIVVPEHDKLRGDNVLVVRGALHHVTAAKLDAARQEFAGLFTDLPRPLIGVLVGGADRHQDFATAIVDELGAKLVQAAKGSGGSVAVTPSRRTDETSKAILRRRLADAGTPHYFWDGRGANPYFGLLALSDVIIVTSDSASMVSEACSTGKPVYVEEVAGSGRLQAFCAGLVADRVAASFTGDITGWDGEAWQGRQVMDETRRTADYLRQKFNLFPS